MGNTIEAHRKVPNEVRREVEVEAAFRCAICEGTSTLELHHIVPYSKGGKHSFENLILLCATCHGRCERDDITREDLRAMKKRLAQKDSIASLDKQALKQIMTELLQDVLKELEPTLDRFRSLAAHRQLSVSKLVEDTYGKDYSQLIMAALDEGNDALARSFFVDKINNEKPLITLQGRGKFPLYLQALRYRERGPDIDYQNMRRAVEQVSVPCGEYGSLSLGNVIALSSEVPDQYVGLPYIRFAVLGRVNGNIPMECGEKVEKHLLDLGILFSSRISDVDYDYHYFFKFTENGLAFQNWLHEHHRAASNV